MHALLFSKFARFRRFNVRDFNFHAPQTNRIPRGFNFRTSLLFYHKNRFIKIVLSLNNMW